MRLCSREYIEMSLKNHYLFPKINSLFQFLGLRTGCEGKSHCKSDWFDKIKLTAELKNYLQSLVNWSNKLLVNFNVSETKVFSFIHLRKAFLYSISMADTSIKERNSLCHVALQFYTDMNWDGYIESLARLLLKNLV